MSGLSPFIKWAGGKEKELPYIAPRFPESVGRYLEPFVGGGAVYLNIGNAREYLINDKSKELIGLYRMIKEENEAFFEKLYEINDNWLLLEKIVDRHADEFIGKYSLYSNDRLTKAGLDAYFTDFVLSRADEFNGLLSPSSNIEIGNFIKEIKRNLTEKTSRMKKLEGRKGRLTDGDVIKNIETGFKSAYYMHFRYLYNSLERFGIGEPFGTAIFYFVREYCYASMFRYNRNGEFNVPYGGMSYNRKDFRRKIDYLRSADLIARLRGTDIYCLDFREFLDRAEPAEGDFIFLDPPYDTEFSDYGNMAFTKDDQVRLAEFLYGTGANFMLVIKNTAFISDLYHHRGFHIFSFNKKYLVSFQNRNDKEAEHLVITNY